jgi:predicted TIM-barrel fold metal-dependent hydrolase
MIVDIHANLYHPSWYPKVFQDSLVQDFLRRQIEAGRDPDASKLESRLQEMLVDRDGSKTIRLMDKAGFDRKLVMIMDWGLALGEAEKSIQTINQEILSICARHPDRLSGFVGVDPRRENAAEIVWRSIEDFGAKGLKLHPTTGWKLSDESCHRIVDTAVQCGLPILVHIGKTIKELSDEHARPSDLIELAEHFPGGLFVAGHSGFDRWREFAEHTGTPDNVVFEISGWQEIVNGDQERFDEHFWGLMSAFPKRVHFGTDGPFYSFNLVASERHWLDMVQNSLGRCPKELASTADTVTDPGKVVVK